MLISKHVNRKPHGQTVAHPTPDISYRVKSFDWAQDKLYLVSIPRQILTVARASSFVVLLRRTAATAKHGKQRILCSELSEKARKKPQIAQISPIGWMGKRGTPAVHKAKPVPAKAGIACDPLPASANPRHTLHLIRTTRWYAEHTLHLHLNYP